MAFTDEQLERYSRHIILKEVGAKGQKKLLNAKVLIIGAGGLGLFSRVEQMECIKLFILGIDPVAGKTSAQTVGTVMHDGN